MKKALVPGSRVSGYVEFGNAGWISDNVVFIGPITSPVPARF